MWLHSLISGPFLGRRKRFFADVALPDGPVVAHCANTGSMKSLLLPGSIAYLTHHSNPARKLAYTLELLRLSEGAWACVNTQRPNAQVAEALQMGFIHGFPAGCRVEREVPCSAESRIDLRVILPSGPVWIEVKNVTLAESPCVASFPDAVSARGTKHLRELAARVRAGERAAMFYLVNRDDVSHFHPAAEIDPLYAKELQNAVQVGVEVLVYQTRFTISFDGTSVEMRVGSPLRWSLDS
ncbi:MAG TPA: DNA/RNA nuclease SfsA [Fibrobacteraceae bacterium]|nr:DNA/RNA nuclease SfsA [Fibrobacteraceae bacterium]